MYHGRAPVKGYCWGIFPAVNWVPIAPMTAMGTFPDCPHESGGLLLQSAQKADEMSVTSAFFHALSICALAFAAALLFCSA